MNEGIHLDLDTWISHRYIYMHNNSGRILMLVLLLGA